MPKLMGYIFELPNGCANFNNTIKLFCLPKKVKCNNTTIDGIYVSSDEDLCKNGCNGRPYKMPFPPGAKLQFQTNFLDRSSTDYTNPNQGLGSWYFLHLYDLTGYEFSANVAARKVNGFDGNQNYQTFEINTNNITRDCFYAQIEVGGSSIYTQVYQKETCKELVEFEPVYDEDTNSKDCYGAYYGKSKGSVAGTDFNFLPKAWIRGTVKYEGANLKTKIEKIKIVPSELIPAWYLKYLINRIFSAPRVKINGEIYNTPDISISSNNRSTSFNFSIELERTCSNKNDGSDFTCN